ncbi:MAG: hypothetical protein R3A50_03400 [Saprospiraceae bacterium]|nr:hypothetical protein [Saprospiraceae bacterium]MCB9343765.1 hypothetical protein [Lewinellaceae bacterium]
MNKFLPALTIFLLCLSGLKAQDNTRLFLDVPSIYITSPNVENIGHQLGLGGGFAMNVGTHWSVARLGIGAHVTADPQSDDFESSILTTPYALFEAGAGKYRSNGDRCAQTKRAAFTALGKAGILYNFDTRKVKPAEDDANFGIDYTVGVELGYFYIRDVFKNMEVVLDSRYHINAKVVSVNFGFKLFLNLKADRPY